MILRIEVWDWESHEHTVIDGISAGLNLFCGDSNSGKTSIVRALSLVAYNQFDPKCIRTGATKCVVLVETEKGTVQVTRGPKHNLWETTKKGQATQYFDKVGVNIVPEAAEILGLNIVTLGDVQIPVNIMDQLESHFMLSGIGDKNASGSMRAQIVDEISGLSGIESLIKDVSLDHHRFGREVKETETKMEETRNQLHPESELKAEETILGKAEKELADHDQMVILVNEGLALVSSAGSVRQGLQAAEAALQKIPDTDLAISEIERADGKAKKASAAELMLVAGQSSSGRLAGVQGRLSGMPNEQDAFSYLDEADQDVAISETAETFLRQCVTSQKNLKAKQDRLDEISKVSADQDITDATTLLEHKVKAEELLVSAQRVYELRANIMRQIVANFGELQVAEKNRDDLLTSIKTCPLTLRPVSKECVS